MPCFRCFATSHTLTGYATMSPTRTANDSTIQNRTEPMSVVPAKSVRKMTITGIMPAMTQFIDSHSALGRRAAQGGRQLRDHHRSNGNRHGASLQLCSKNGPCPEANVGRIDDAAMGRLAPICRRDWGRPSAQETNRLTNPSAVSATSRQPLSMVNAWPRPGISMNSVTPLFFFCFL